MGIGNMEIDVVCFYWDGEDRPGWKNKDLGEEYVNKLYNGVKRHLNLPFEFHCFTNFDDFKINHEIHKKKLDVKTWKGCLPKLKAFDPSNGFRDRVIVMDIDIVVVGCLDEIFSYQGYFMTREGFRGKNRNKSGGDIVFFKANGSMSWIWDMMENEPEKLEEWTGGRERFVYRKYLHDDMDFLQWIWPKAMLSYKNHLKNRTTIPNDCKLVSFHGNPRPHTVNKEWVRMNWL